MRCEEPYPGDFQISAEGFSLDKTSIPDTVAHRVDLGHLIKGIERSKVVKL